MSTEWRFEQLDGPKRIIKLVGYAAPFGRPRQKPLYSDKNSLRQTVTRYPDSIKEPTHHTFGTRRHDLELSGRWMDNKLGAGAAAALVAQFDQFVDDAVRCRVSWGDVNSYVGYLESIESRWESSTQVAWTLVFSTDSKDGDAVVRTIPELDHKKNTQRLVDALGIQLVPALNARGGWKPDLLDAIDSAIASIAGFTGSLAKIAGQFSNLESATANELQRFRGAINQLRTAIVKYENTIGFALADFALFVRQSETDIAWFQYQHMASRQNSIALAILADLERDCVLAERGKNKTSYTARTGDTWESIAIQIYGDPEGADALRAANGVKLGVLPVPGKKYKVPQK